MNYANTLEELRCAMQACEQAPGLNMLQHGELVHQKYKELITELEGGDTKRAELLAVYEKFHLPPPEVLERYHVYHDCGKHLCLEEVDGKRRFPNHAEVSANQYAHLYPEDGFTINLIKRDMDFHVARGEELVNLCKSPFAPILYLTAWAEIIANASMFGGEESESFKIKRSRLIQAGKKLLNR